MVETTFCWEKEVLTDALNSMEEALVVYDSNGCLLACNQSFLDMYSYSPDQAKAGVHYQELGEIIKRCMKTDGRGNWVNLIFVMATWL